MFEFEPKITEELKGLKNVVLAPHVGNATFETRDAMAETAVRNILAVLNGEEAVTPVNQKYSLQKKKPSGIGRFLLFFFICSFDGLCLRN